MSSILKRVQELAESGRLNGSQLRLYCPHCASNALDIAMGSKGLLLANCLVCKLPGPQLLAKLSLPCQTLSKADQEAIDNLLGGRASVGKPLPPAQPAEILDKVYSAWLKLCPLDKEANQFAKEHYGLSNARGYGKWPTEGLGEALEKQFGREILERVPGLYWNGSRIKVALDDTYYAGLLVPVRNVRGQIVALKVRLYNPTPDGKMRTFSSAAFDGPQGLFCVHVPQGVKGSTNTKVTIVEGELKADVAYHHLKSAVVGIPGVHGISQSIRSVVEALGAERLVLALDQDSAGYQGTYDLMQNLAGDFKIDYAEWDGSLSKGLDDALRAKTPVSYLRGEAALDLILSRVPVSESDSPTTVEDTGLPPARSSSVPSGTVHEGINLYDGLAMLTTDWPSPPFLVPNLLPTGLSILAGKSKIGKSFAVLDLCVSIATGTPFLGENKIISPGKVLYLALEDTPRNISSRMSSILKGREDKRELLSSNLIIAPTTSRIPRMPKGALWLKNVLQSSDFRLVVIDTLERFRPADEDGRSHNYSGDYSLMAQLKTWAEDHALGILLVHHVRKNSVQGADVFDSILGSTGILGAADTVLLLEKNRGDVYGKLRAVGREVQEVDQPVRWDSEMGRFYETTKEEVAQIKREEKIKSGQIGSMKDLVMILLKDGEEKSAADLVEEGIKRGLVSESSRPDAVITNVRKAFKDEGIYELKTMKRGGGGKPTMLKLELIKE